MTCATSCADIFVLAKEALWWKHFLDESREDESIYFGGIWQFACAGTFALNKIEQ